MPDNKADNDDKDGLWGRDNGEANDGSIVVEQTYEKPVSLWSKTIPAINISFMVVSLMLIIFVDLGMALSQPMLLPYLFVMLFVLVFFIRFVFYENGYMRKRLSSSISDLDKWLVLMIVVRNIVYVLNFIPVIQILGAGLLFLGGIPHIIIYYKLLDKRNSTL